MPHIPFLSYKMFSTEKIDKQVAFQFKLNVTELLLSITHKMGLKNNYN